MAVGVIETIMPFLLTTDVLVQICPFAVRADAFAFLEDAARSKERWDLVIVDPPS